MKSVNYKLSGKLRCELHKQIRNKVWWIRWQNKFYDRGFGKIDEKIWFNFQFKIYEKLVWGIR